MKTVMMTYVYQRLVMPLALHKFITDINEYVKDYSSTGEKLGRM